MLIFLLCFIQIKQKLILLCNIQKQPHHTFKEKKLETYNRRTLHYDDRWKCILLALTVKLITCDWLVPLLRNPLEWHKRPKVKCFYICLKKNLLQGRIWAKILSSPWKSNLLCNNSHRALVMRHWDKEKHCKLLKRISFSSFFFVCRHLLTERVRMKFIMQNVLIYFKVYSESSKCGYVLICNFRIKK